MLLRGCRGLLSFLYRPDDIGRGLDLFWLVVRDDAQTLHRFAAAHVPQFIPASEEAMLLPGELDGGAVVNVLADGRVIKAVQIVQVKYVNPVADMAA